MNEPKDDDEGFGEIHCYASVYDEIIRKRKAAGGNMAMGKHTAANAVCCQRVIEDLQAAAPVQCFVHRAAEASTWR